MKMWDFRVRGFGAISVLAIASCALYAAAPAPAVAASGWYQGVVTRLALTGADASFIVTFDSPVLDDCANKYAYFLESRLGTGKVRNAYSIALASLTTGRTMGVVLDKAANGPGGHCYATGMTADLR